MSIKCKRLVTETLSNHISVILLCYYAVTLSSSADSLCPGDGVVFTCVTDTGRLIWDITSHMHTHSYSYHSPAQLTDPSAYHEIFIITLHNITGENNNTYHSTATAVHVPITYNRSTVECSGKINALGTNNTERTIVIGIN